MQYQIIKKYDCTETTCGELVELFKTSKGDVYCAGYEFIDPDFPYDACDLITSWDWIQARSPLKKLYLISEIKSTGSIIK